MKKVLLKKTLIDIYSQEEIDIQALGTITSIEGLDGNTAQIDTQHIPYVNGEYVTNKSINGRDIIINLAFETMERPGSVPAYQYKDRISAIRAFISCGEQFQLWVKTDSRAIIVPVEPKGFEYSRFEKGVKGQLKLFCPAGALKGRKVRLTNGTIVEDDGGINVNGQFIHFAKDPWEMVESFIEANEVNRIDVQADVDVWPRFEINFYDSETAYNGYAMIESMNNHLKIFFRDFDNARIKCLKVETDPSKRAILAKSDAANAPWVNYLSNLDYINCRWGALDCFKQRLQDTYTDWIRISVYDQFDRPYDTWDVDVYYDEMWIGV